jgi:hypothetical protein
MKLKAALQIHGGKDWAAVAALVPGRTRIQCHSRWRKACRDDDGDMARNMIATENSIISGNCSP